MLDVPAIIREALVRTTGTLYAHTSTRVWENTAPGSFANSQKAIIFNIQGGTSNPIHEDYQMEVMFRCFGGDGINQTSVNSRAVAAALWTDIHGAGIVQYRDPITTANGVILTAFCDDAAGSVMIDPDANWWHVLTMYTMRFKPR